METSKEATATKCFSLKVELYIYIYMYTSFWHHYVLLTNKNHARVDSFNLVLDCSVAWVAGSRHVSA